MSGTTPPQFENRGTGPNVAPLREWDPVAAQDDIYGRLESLERQRTFRGMSNTERFRIEALRAAVQVCADGCAAEIIVEDYCKRFERYLESGE